MTFGDAYAALFKNGICRERMAWYGLEIVFILTRTEKNTFIRGTMSPARLCRSIPVNKPAANDAN